MKTFYLLLLPFFVFSQGEIGHKMNIRGGGSFNQGGGYYSRISPPPMMQEQQQKQTIRRENYQRPSTNSYYYNNYWYNGGMWGWSYWGAPYYGYNSWYPYYYYNNGYIQPARIYVYNDKRDTIRAQRPILSMGIQGSSNTLGGFFVVGGKNYFIMDASGIVSRDKSVFYPTLTMDVVQPFKDQRLSNIKSGFKMYIGAGHWVTSHVGLHVQLGAVSLQEKYQYYDEFKILSNNGRYSFPNYDNTYLTVKGGLLYRMNFMTIKADYDPFEDEATIGVGVLF